MSLKPSLHVRDIASSRSAMADPRTELMASGARKLSCRLRSLRRPYGREDISDSRRMKCLGRHRGRCQGLSSGPAAERQDLADSEASGIGRRMSLLKLRGLSRVLSVGHWCSCRCWAALCKQLGEDGPASLIAVILSGGCCNRHGGAGRLEGEGLAPLAAGLAESLQQASEWRALPAGWRCGAGHPGC